MYPTEKSKNKTHYGLFECPYCKKHFKAIISNVKKGDTRSCGCYIKTLPIHPNYKHGLTKSKIYKTWRSLSDRCYNKNNPNYKNYGGRGITVCDEWRNDFMNFYDWSIANGYTATPKGIRNSIQIDRIENDGNYEPSNCRWATCIINSQNTRLIMPTNKSGYRGVRKYRRRWRVVIGMNRKYYELGTYSTAEEAAQAYNNFVIKNKTHHPLNIIKSKDT